MKIVLMLGMLATFSCIAMEEQQKQKHAQNIKEDCEACEMLQEKEWRAKMIRGTSVSIVKLKSYDHYGDKLVYGVIANDHNHTITDGEVRDARKMIKNFWRLHQVSQYHDELDDALVKKKELCTHPSVVFTVKFKNIEKLFEEAD